MGAQVKVATLPPAIEANVSKLYTLLAKYEAKLIKNKAALLPWARVEIYPEPGKKLNCNCYIGILAVKDQGPKLCFYCIDKDDPVDNKTSVTPLTSMSLSRLASLLPSIHKLEEAISTAEADLAADLDSCINFLSQQVNTTSSKTTTNGNKPAKPRKGGTRPPSS